VIIRYHSIINEIIDCNNILEIEYNKDDIEIVNMVENNYYKLLKFIFQKKIIFKFKPYV